MLLQLHVLVASISTDGEFCVTCPVYCHPVVEDNGPVDVALCLSAHESNDGHLPAPEKRNTRAGTGGQWVGKYLFRVERKERHLHRQACMG